MKGQNNIERLSKITKCVKSKLGVSEISNKKKDGTSSIRCSQILERLVRPK